jgi:hypothetical protein
MIISRLLKPYCAESADIIDAELDFDRSNISHVDRIDKASKNALCKWNRNVSMPNVLINKSMI